MVHVFPKTSPPIVPNRKTTKIFTVTILTHTHTKKKKKKLSIASGGEACSSNRAGSVEGSQDNEWNRSEIDGPFCPICMKSWTNDGDHYIWLVLASHFLPFFEPYIFDEFSLPSILGFYYNFAPTFSLLTIFFIAFTDHNVGIAQILHLYFHSSVVFVINNYHYHCHRKQLFMRTLYDWMFALGSVHFHFFYTSYWCFKHKECTSLGAALE